MSLIKITQLPVISSINANTANTLFVGVDIPTDTTFQLTANTLATGLYRNSYLNVGNNNIQFPNTIAQFSGSDPTFLQVNQQNFDANGTSDYVLTADTGTNYGGYIDLGINNSQWNAAAAGQTSQYPFDGYLIVDGPATTPTGNLVIGTANPGTNVVFAIAGYLANNIVATLTANGLVLNTQSYMTFGDGTFQSTAAAPYAYSNAAFSYANTQVGLLYGVEATQNTSITASFTEANAAFLQANSAYAQANGASIYANGAFAEANAGYTQANSAFTAANTAAANTVNLAGVNLTQNTSITAAFLQANSGFSVANSASLYANGAFLEANAAYSQANSASLYANGAFVEANSAYASQNTTGVYANAAFGVANSASLYANGAFIQANAAYTMANNTANSAGSYANSAFSAANTAAANTVNLAGVNLTQNTSIAASFTQANAAFTTANNALANTNNALFAGNLQITGNILPTSSNTYSLGSPTNRFENLYLGGASLHIIDEITGNDTSITVRSGALQVNNANVFIVGNTAIYANGTIAAPNVQVTSNLAVNNTFVVNVIQNTLTMNGTVTIQSSTFPATTSSVRIDGSNNGIAQQTTASGTMLQLTGLDGGYATRMIVDNYSLGNTAAYPLIAGRAARGNSSNPSTVQTGDLLMRLGGNGYGTSGFTLTGGASVDFIAAENYTDSTKGSTITFNTTPNGTNVRSATATVNSSLFAITSNTTTANTLVANTLVYGSATANSLTVQSSTKSTSVSVTGLTGQIQMAGSSLAGQSQVSFTVNNPNVLHVNDIIIVNIQNSVTTPNPYIVTVGTVATGSFVISLYNTSVGGGSAHSDSVVLNWAILRVGS